MVALESRNLRRGVSAEDFEAADGFGRLCYGALPLRKRAFLAMDAQGN